VEKTKFLAKAEKLCCSIPFWSFFTAVDTNVIYCGFAGYLVLHNLMYIWIVCLLLGWFYGDDFSGFCIQNFKQVETN